MRKLFVLLLLLLAVTGVAGAQSGDLRVFEPMDRSLNYRFSYPMASHSVRTSNLFEPYAEDVPLVFGGLIAVEPNDSYIYVGPSFPEERATRMRVLAFPVASAPANLASLAGTLPLWHSDSIGSGVQPMLLGGQPAVRVDDADRQATEIIAYYDGAVYEIVIEPVVLYMGFRLESWHYDPVYDQLLASWEFAQLAG